MTDSAEKRPKPYLLKPGKRGEITRMVLTRQCAQKALGGDPAALRGCLASITWADSVTMPAVNTVHDLPRITLSLIAAVAFGRITPEELAVVVQVSVIPCHSRQCAERLVG